jgi:hypothetical protein
MGSYCRQPSFPPTPKMIIPLTSKSLSMRIASGFPSLLTIRPPMLNRRTHHQIIWHVSLRTHKRYSKPETFVLHLMFSRTAKCEVFAAEGGNHV